jgi:hypothetical protein
LFSKRGRTGSIIIIIIIIITTHTVPLLSVIGGLQQSRHFSFGVRIVSVVACGRRFLAGMLRDYRPAPHANHPAE